MTGQDAWLQVEVTSVDELRAWLAEHHDTLERAWLITWKKADRDRHVSYEELVRQLLCFGWIDSTARSMDAQRTGLLIARRRPKSGWSRPNKVRVAELIEAGLMQPAGQAAIDAAKASGAWTVLDDIENLVEPSDLRAALDANPAARGHWDAFPRSVKRSILVWVGDAKRVETRTKRIVETVELAADNIRAHQP
jgi:uncharacterized protein YdeI (YjbR/CyaY-like superfamily)